MAKKKEKIEKETRVNRNIQIDKNYYDKPVFVLDNIDDNDNNKNIFNYKYFNLILIVVAAILVGILLFYFINYDYFNSKGEVKTVVVDKNYLFLGDSLTEFYDLDKYYPDKKLKVVNSGVKGNTTNNILDNMYNRVYRYNPSDIFILVGTNDIPKNSLQNIFDNYVSIVSQIEKNRPSATIRIISLYPVNHDIRPKDKRTMSAIINLNESLKIFAKNNNIQYIDLYSKLVDENGNLDIRYTKDGLHLNDEGYKIVTEVLSKYMED